MGRTRHRPDPLASNPPCATLAHWPVATPISPPIQRAMSRACTAVGRHRANPAPTSTAPNLTPLVRSPLAPLPPPSWMHLSMLGWPLARAHPSTSTLRRWPGPWCPRFSHGQAAFGQILHPTSTAPNLTLLVLANPVLLAYSASAPLAAHRNASRRTHAPDSPDSPFCPRCARLYKGHPSQLSTPVDHHSPRW
jgi:hypothetical protein